MRGVRELPVQLGCQHEKDQRLEWSSAAASVC
jgi:hypothetical protein